MYDQTTGRGYALSKCPKDAKDRVKRPKAFDKTHIYGHMFQETPIATNLLSIIPGFCTCSLLKLEVIISAIRMGSW